MFDAFDDDLALGDDQAIQFELILAASVSDSNRASLVARPIGTPPAVPETLFLDSGIVASLREINNDSGFFEAPTSVVSIPPSSSGVSSDTFLQSANSVEHIHGLVSPPASGNDNVSRERTEFRLRSTSPVHGKRLFPGPAGKLTTRTSPGSADSVQRPSKRACWTTSMDHPDFQDLEGNNDSQVLNDEIFRYGPWAALRHDLAESGGMMGHFGPEMLDKCNVAYLLRKASKNRLHNRKAPSLLCVLLQAIDYGYSGRYCRVVLRDPTGEMVGWMDRDVTKEFGYKLKPGCVLVLNKPSVLSVDQKRHLLSIHRCNIMKIYVTANDGNIVRLEPAINVRAESSSTDLKNWIDGSDEFQVPHGRSVIDNKIPDVCYCAAATNGIADGRQPPLPPPSSSRSDLNVGPPLNVVSGPNPCFGRQATECCRTMEPVSSSRTDTTNKRFRPEHDPLWNDDDFEDLMLKLDQ